MKIIFLTIALTFFFSCTEKVDSSLLNGSWNLQEWVRQVDNSPISGTMQFIFKDDGRYTVDYGSEKEVGKYWIMGEYLHTLEDGQAEKKVLITKLTTDTLSFEMNRAGSMEHVVFLKAK